MPCHVRGQNDAHKSLAESFKVIARDFLQEIVLWLHQNLESLRSVEILLHCLIIVPNGTVRNCINVVRIVKSIVLEVVAHCGRDD